MSASGTDTSSHVLLVRIWGKADTNGVPTRRRMLDSSFLPLRQAASAPAKGHGVSWGNRDIHLEFR